METFKQEAIEFLKQEFHPDLNYDLHLETTFNNYPIKGAQPTELYSFEVQSETHENFLCLPAMFIQWCIPIMDLLSMSYGRCILVWNISSNKE